MNGSIFIIFAKKQGQTGKPKKTNTKRMDVTIKDFISVLETEFDNIPKDTLNSDTVISSVIEMSSINALIFLALIKTEFDILLTAEDLINSNTINDLYTIIFSKPV